MQAEPCMSLEIKRKEIGEINFYDIYLTDCVQDTILTCNNLKKVTASLHSLVHTKLFTFVLNLTPHVLFH